MAAGAGRQLVAFGQGRFGCIFEADDAEHVYKIELKVDTGWQYPENEIMEGIRQHYVEFPPQVTPNIVLTKMVEATLKSTDKSTFQVLWLPPQIRPAWITPKPMHFTVPKDLGDVGDGGCNLLLKHGTSTVMFSIMPKYKGDCTKPPYKGDELIQDLAVEMNVALTTLKRVGVIHRDIKPENIMWRMDADYDYEFALGDFGLATWTDRSDMEHVGKPGYTNDPVISGTPEFANREMLVQYEDMWVNDTVAIDLERASSFASDRFALGATLLDIWANERMTDKPKGPPRPMLDGLTPYMECKPNNHEKWTWLTKTIDAWEDYFLSAALNVPHTFGMPPGTAMSADIKLCIGSLYLGEQEMLSATYEHYRSSGNAHILGALVKYILDHIEAFEDVDADDIAVLEYNAAYSPSGALYGPTALEWVQRPELLHVVERLMGIGSDGRMDDDDAEEEAAENEYNAAYEALQAFYSDHASLIDGPITSTKIGSRARGGWNVSPNTSDLNFRRVDYSGHNVRQLKELLQTRGQPTDGNKPDLINRLNKAPDISAWYVESSEIPEAERVNVQEVTKRHNAWRAARNKIEAWNTIEVVLFKARSAGATEERIETLESKQRDLTIEPLPGGYVPFSAIIAARLPPELKDEMAAKETAFATAAAAYIKTMEKDEAEEIEEDSQRKAESENWRLDWEGEAMTKLQRLGRNLNADPPYNDEVVETENQWYAKPKEIEILQRLLNEMKRVTVDEDLAAVLNQVRNLPDGMRPSNEWWQEVAVPFYRPVQPAEGTADAPIVLSDSESDSDDVVAMEAVFTEVRTTETYYLVERWISDYHAEVDAAWKAQQRALTAKLKQLYADHLFNHTDYFEVVGWEALRNYLKENEGVTVLREGDAEYETLCSGADVERPPKCTLTFRQMVDELLTLHYTGHELPEYLEDEFGIGTLLDLFDEIDWNATAMNVDAYRKMALAIEHSNHTDYVDAVQTLWAPEELRRLGIDPADPDAEKVRAAFLATYTDAESPEVLAFLEADAEFRRKYDINYDSTDLPLTLTEEELRLRTPMAENLLEEIVRFTYHGLTGVSLPPARHDTGAANGEMEVDLDGFTLGQLPSYTEAFFEGAQPYFRGDPSAAKDLLVAASRKYAKRLAATPVFSEALETLGVEKWDVLVKDKAWLCPGLDATVKKKRLYVHAVERDDDTTFVTFSGASTGRDPYDYLQDPNPTVEVSRPASGAEEAYVAYPLGEIARELDLAIPFDEDVESEEEDSDYDERDDQDPWDQQFQQLGRNPDPGFDYTDRTLQLEDDRINLEDWTRFFDDYGALAARANERKLRRAYFEENAKRGFPLRTGIVDRFVKKARAKAIANAKYGPTGAVYSPVALAAKRAFPTHADGNDSDASETSSGIDTNSDYDSDRDSIATDVESMSEGDEILGADEILDPDEVLEDWGRKVRETYTPEILQLEQEWRDNGRPRDWQTTFEEFYSEFDRNAAAAGEFGRDEKIEQIGNEISAEIDEKNERPIAYNVYLGRKEVYDVDNNTSLAASLNPITQKPPWRCLTVPGVASYFTWTSTTDRSPMSDAWWRQGRAIARPIQSKGNIAIVDMHPDVFIRMVGELLAVDQPSRAQVNDMETVVEFICTLGVFECALLSRQAWLMTDELEPNSWTETRLKFITAFFEKVRRKFTLKGWLKYHSRLGYCGTPDAETFDPTVKAILFGQEFAAGGYQASAIDRYIFEVYPYRELVPNCNLRLEVILNCRDKRPLDAAGGERPTKRAAHYTDRVFI